MVVHDRIRLTDPPPEEAPGPPLAVPGRFRRGVIGRSRRGRSRSSPAMTVAWFLCEGLLTFRSLEPNPLAMATGAGEPQGEIPGANFGNRAG